MANLYSRRYTKTVTTYIHNALSGSGLSTVGDKYARQPFLSQGWTIWKVRFAFNKQGKSNGTRTIVAANGSQLLIVKMYVKSQEDDEGKIEADFKARIKNYLEI